MQRQLLFGANDNYQFAQVAFFLSNPTAANAFMSAGLEKKNALLGETLTKVDNCRQSPPLIVAEHSTATIEKSLRDWGMVIVTRQDNPGGSVVFHVDAG